MPSPRPAKNWMNSDTSRPSISGPMTTPSSNSTTTAGNSNPRPVTSADSVPATADVPTTARNSDGSTWIAARTIAGLTPGLKPQRAGGASCGSDDVASRLCSGAQHVHGRGDNEDHDGVGDQ